MTGSALFVLFVADQRASASFYTSAFGTGPIVDEPGMTQFALPGGGRLGLMPERGIERLLGGAVQPSASPGATRAEVYLVVDDPAAWHARALAAGARELSPLAPRDWGHEAAYSLDPDGHLLAFARF